MTKELYEMTKEELTTVWETDTDIARNFEELRAQDIQSLVWEMMAHVSSHVDKLICEFNGHAYVELQEHCYPQERNFVRGMKEIQEAFPLFSTQEAEYIYKVNDKYDVHGDMDVYNPNSGLLADWLSIQANKIATILENKLKTFNIYITLDEGLDEFCEWVWNNRITIESPELNF
ncbi:hypothetical protein LP125_011 [Listeria phage LP-125]|uniref:Uncharacterized protein n=3 Tax=Pecentumvirus TaxID=1857844 RepID=S4UC31_9CAUD|nr:hypothetical protein QLX35_gp012 [Listeria phage LP-125]YP_009592541.1 hypothetical protein FDG78_gp012 [Listeria phage LP-064]AGI11336.1 hypothetical protein LP125_011 [Listeria phage LP-125]AHL19032.1 hypothetical protein LP064_012 [Listeria phage LP-064]QNL32146.1 hypothetical protein HUK30_0184 [Listeria phage LP-Mix_6.2]